MSASVLLNFANGVDFTPTDPLMGMVRTGAKLLSYDLLSVGQFRDTGTEDEKREFIRKKVSQLRNMLEDRSLSSEDQGERIRLIIVLDFKPWDFLKPADTEENIEFDAAYPSLKLDYIKEIINDVFGLKNPLHNRIDYNVLFADDNRDEHRSKRYRLMAYHGYYYMEQWENFLSVNSFCLNKYRDKTLDDMNHPDANTELKDPSINKFYISFWDELQNLNNRVKHFLKTIGKESDFAEAVQKTLEITTVKDFTYFDFDGELKNIVKNTAGLGADRFRDCTFFILNMKQNIASQKSRDEIALKSLVQLLCTMDDNQYNMQFRPAADNDFHKLFIIADPDDDDINRAALLRYSDDISTLGAQVGGPNWWDPESTLTGMNWDSSKEVNYNVYKPKNANAEGGHQAQNEIVDEIGNEKRKKFKEKREVPFFFGIELGDWRWYRDVTQAFDDCLQYERNNNRPLVENLTRDSDSELTKTTKTTTYADLNVQIKDYSINDIQSKVDYETYILNRKEKIEQLAKKSENMKNELVKLGFRSRLVRILFLSSLAFTLCFAYHFFYDESPDHPLWIAAGFACICLVLTVGTFVAQLIVKNKINSVYRDIDNIFYELKKIANDHLKSVNDLATEMNEADANRKTLSEMKANYGEWNRHNKKVETWVNYSRNMNLLLDNYLSDISFNKTDSDQTTEGIAWNVDETILDIKPCVVAQIWSQIHYSDMQPVIEVTNQNRRNTINNATCFISHFKFTSVF